MARKTVDISKIRHSRALEFLYETAPGRCVLKVMTQVWVSKLVGTFMETALSIPMIAPTVKKYGIDMTRFVPEKYTCYNRFFTRQLRQEYRKVGEGLISPCDGKLTAYPITDDLVFTVKGSDYSIADILESSELARQFRGGMCLIFRLTVDDFHRYGYFDDCREAACRYIRGVLHTVQPIAFRRNNVYKRNCREYTVLETEHFGRAIQVEVGATCVGRIKNHHAPGSHRKGEEKGMFLFGGSTILLLLKDCELDDEILRNSRDGLETVVRFGETIGL